MIERDWKTDPATGELVFSNGDIVMVSGLDSIRQDVEQVLVYARGEWFLDPQDPTAMPMFEEILVKAPSEPVLREIYRRRILAVRGIVSIDSISVELDRAQRTVRVRFLAQTDEGLLNFDSARA